MKAIEYYEKHKDIIKHIESEDVDMKNNGIRDLLLEFFDESLSLRELRHSTTTGGLIAIIKELNKKWNALTRIFIKKHGFTPIKEDGFKNYICSKIPEVKELW